MTTIIYLENNKEEFQLDKNGQVAFMILQNGDLMLRKNGKPFIYRMKKIKYSIGACGSLLKMRVELYD